MGTGYKDNEILMQELALIALQERDRLARELHDSLGQVLGYVNTQIETVKKLLENNQTQAVEDHLDALSKVVEEANAEIREFIYEVRKTLILKDGFFLALSKYLLHFEQLFSIKTEFQNPDNITDEEIGLSVGIQLFRIIQESLTNVRKHAKADKVSISFHRNEGNIIVSVADNGVGFRRDEIKNKTTYGLSVMKERASIIGGLVQIDSAPSRGTLVTVVFPRSPSKPPIPAGIQENPKFKVLLADDHLLFMDGLKTLLEQHEFEVVGTARDGFEALEKARMLHPDLILMDLNMPRCNGIIATKLINMEMPDIKIVILSMMVSEQELFKAIKNGASGYLIKGLSSEDFIEQLRSLACHGTVISPEIASQVMEELSLPDDPFTSMDLINCLSQRQIEILSLIAKGLTYKEIAAKLYICERTVKYEMSNILKLLHLKNRSEAVFFAHKAGLVKKA